VPFKSKSQMKLFYAKARSGEISPSVVKEWQNATPDAKSLPDKLEKKAFTEAFEIFVSKANNPILKELKDIKKDRTVIKVDGSQKSNELEGNKVDNDALAGKSN
jgi:hypothetical protein